MSPSRRRRTYNDKTHYNQYKQAHISKANICIFDPYSQFSAALNFTFTVDTKKANEILAIASGLEVNVVVRHL